MKSLIAYINRFQPLDIETENAVSMHFKREVFRKNDFLVEAGKTCTKLYFIERGLVRRFCDHEGHDHTIWFYHDNHWFTSLASYLNRKPATEFIQAADDTAVFSLTYTDEQVLLQYPAFLRFHTTLLRYSLAAFDEFHFTFAQLSAQNKYLYLLEKFPIIVQRAKQKHIASLLNVSQETLSRIRSVII